MLGVITVDVLSLLLVLTKSLDVWGWICSALLNLSSWKVNYLYAASHLILMRDVLLILMFTGMPKKTFSM